MNEWNIAAMVATIAVVATMWRTILDFIKNFTLFIFGTVSFDKNLVGPIYLYCLKNMKLVSIRKKNYVGCRANLKNQDKDKLIAFEILYHNTVVFQKGWRFVIISPGEWFYDEVLNKYKQSISVSLPRLMWNSTEFIKTALNHYNDHEDDFSVKRFNISFFHGKTKVGNVQINADKERAKNSPTGKGDLISDAKIGKVISVNNDIDDIDIDTAHPFEFFPFPKSIMNHINDIELWHKNESWYKKKGIPWKQGWLLHGKPGSGKTLLLKCIAQKFDLPVFVFDLASMSNEEFSDFWEKAMNESPCMILFEDFDSIFNGRENVACQEKGITFDILLNCISGIQNYNGLFLAITTNNLEKIDSALATKTDGITSRPGRIDKIIELQEMDEDCRSRFAHRIFDSQEDWVEEIINQGEGMTAAQFSNLCSTVCLENLKKTRDEIIIDYDVDEVICLANSFVEK